MGVYVCSPCHGKIDTLSLNLQIKIEFDILGFKIQVKWPTSKDSASRGKYWGGSSW